MHRPNVRNVLPCLSLALLLLPASAAAQTAGSPPPAARITVTLTATGVRFSALGAVTHVRLEVFGPAGEAVYSSGFLPGNVRDWTARGPDGATLPDGAYACVLTAREAGGGMSTREGVLVVSGGQVSIQLGGGGAVTEATRDSGSEGPGAMTVVAHDGTAGQVTSTVGALTFRTGDFFAGGERERVRITEDGRVGVGTNSPEALLDVAGAVRAQGGFRFPDGSTLSSEGGRLKLTGESGVTSTFGASATAATANRLAKFSDPSGALTDALLYEAGGRVAVANQSGGVGVDPTISNPNNVPGFAQFQFYPSAGTNANMSFGVVPRGAGSANNRAQLSLFRTDVQADPVNYEFAALRAREADFVLGTGKSGSGLNRPLVLAAGLLGDGSNDGQLVLAAGGNVGVGTGSPQARLDVAGDVNASTQYNIRGNRVLSISGRNLANTFTGVGAGSSNTPGLFGNDPAGNDNSFFGAAAGSGNTTGFNNSYFGVGAGSSNKLGINNAFFGVNAGAFSTGTQNSYLGVAAGLVTTGSQNTFIGFNSNTSIRAGNQITLLGAATGVSTDNLTNATAIGYGAVVSQSNSVVLGNNANVGAGTSTPVGRFNVVGYEGAGRGVQIDNREIKFRGEGVAHFSLFANRTAGLFTIEDTSSSFGMDAPGTVLMAITRDGGNVGIGTGTAAPDARLQVNGEVHAQTVRINDYVSGGSVPTCVNTLTNQLGVCSSSLRYKAGVRPFRGGLDLVTRLRPIAFTWKQGGAGDVGLGAEEVARVAPQFAFANAAGEVEGVRYDRLPVLLINAVKEQQWQIEQLRQQNARLQAQLRRLERRR